MVIKNTHDNRALCTIHNSRDPKCKGNQEPVILFDYYGDATQFWKLESIGNGNWSIRNSHDNRALCTLHNSKDPKYKGNQEPVILFDYYGDATQSWKIIRIDPIDFYFTPQNGWNMDRHVRTLGDINGDGKDDIIGFYNNKVLVSLSTGSGFKKPRAWLDHYFTLPNGWTNIEHVRTVADVNRDGRDDIVGFGDAGVFVSFSNGSGFTKPELLVKNFAILAGGWEVSKHTRLMADINNDDRADIVGFREQVFSAFSDGNNFGSVTPRGQNFYTNPNWWNLKRHRRKMGDTNGDGKVDIVGFTESKVYVSLSEGGDFGPQKACFENFTYTQGWSPEKYPISLGDINGDGKDDIIGFKDNRVYVAYSKGFCFDSPRAVTFR